MNKEEITSNSSSKMMLYYFLSILFNANKRKNLKSNDVYYKQNMITKICVCVCVCIYKYIQINNNGKS